MESFIDGLLIGLTAFVVYVWGQCKNANQEEPRSVTLDDSDIEYSDWKPDGWTYVE